jgi:hypothetical protein
MILIRKRVILIIGGNFYYLLGKQSPRITLLHDKVGIMHAVNHRIINHIFLVVDGIFFLICCGKDYYTSYKIFIKVLYNNLLIASCLKKILCSWNLIISEGLRKICR